MEDFFSYFWNWLKRNQSDKKVRMAPPAEKRYAKSKKLYPNDPYFENDIRYKNGENYGVLEEVPYMEKTPSMFTKQVFDNDTIYKETPGQKRFSLRGFPKTREASYRNKRGNEYEILKRRFNTAWGLAQ